jgi:hypothetical protein
MTDPYELASTNRTGTSTYEFWEVELSPPFLSLSSPIDPTHNPYSSKTIRCLSTLLAREASNW